MQHKITRLGMFAFAAAAFMACGDDAPTGPGGGSFTALGGSCEGVSFTPCGGDVTGTWTFDAMCFDMGDTMFADDCPEATFDIDITGGGTVTFNGDNTHTATGNTVATITTNYPKSCLPESMTCAMFGQFMGEATDRGDYCEITMVQSNANDDAGTWSADGNTLTVEIEGDDEPVTMEYCVNGNTLMFRQLDTDADVEIITTARR